MKSNVDWTICPECSALNAAQWNQRGLHSYDVSCGDCGHEYERGRFASGGVRLLVHEDIPRDSFGLLPLTPDQVKEILRDCWGDRYDDLWEGI